MDDAKTRKKLPVGIENFGDIRKEGFYYIDKTAMIRGIYKYGIACYRKKCRVALERAEC